MKKLSQKYLKKELNQLIYNHFLDLVKSVVFHFIEEKLENNKKEIFDKIKKGIKNINNFDIFK